MKFKFGDSVATNDGRVGLVIEYYEYDQTYFVKCNDGYGQLYKESELTEWHGCW